MNLWVIRHPDRESWRTPHGWALQEDDAMEFRGEDEAERYVREHGGRGYVVQRSKAPSVRAITAGVALTEYNPWSNG